MSFAFAVEYAKSGRATCKGCKGKIDKASVRVGVKSVGSIEHEETSHLQEASKWYHPDCLNQFRKTAKWWLEHSPQIQAVEGSESLDPEDSKQLEHLLEELRTRVVKTEGVKRLPVNDAEEEEEGGQTASDYESEEDEEEFAKKKKKATTKTAKRKRKDKSSGDEDNESDGGGAKPGSKKSKRSDAKLKSVYEAEALTAEQVQGINDAIDANKMKTIPQLKAMLVKNLQKISGTKGELLERVGEAMVLGSVPNCPTCEGHLRWDRSTGEYNCPGKYDDDAARFRRCSFKSQHVDRLPWIS